MTLSNSLAVHSDIRSLFINDTPLLDARSPIEFQQGAFPNATNLPLMNDEERHQVGIAYKQQGHDAAVALGHSLVCGEIKQQRVQAWKDFINDHPSAVLYCFRGGERSRITQTWLKEAGVDIPRVDGGYKAMRRFLLDVIERAAHECKFVLLSGLTGVGKTEFLQRLPNALDLEGYANHRGSSFGRTIEGQPTQIDFENRLAIAILKARDKGFKTFVVEDEGRMIGSRSIPHSLIECFQSAPIAVLTASDAERLQRLHREYVIESLENHKQVYGDEGFEKFSEFLLDSLYRIRKRLGGERYQELTELMQSALDEQQRSGTAERHKLWLKALLFDYYDPMYRYQLSKKSERIEQQAGHQEMHAWLTRNENL